MFPNYYNFFFFFRQSVKVPTNILTKGDIYSVSLKPFNVHLEQYRIRAFMEMAFLKQLPLICEKFIFSLEVFFFLPYFNALNVFLETSLSN